MLNVVQMLIAKKNMGFQFADVNTVMFHCHLLKRDVPSHKIQFTAILDLVDKIANATFCMELNTVSVFLDSQEIP